MIDKYYNNGWLIKQNHPVLPLTIWNYSQITQYQRYWDEITMQCRGLVTDNDGLIVARPFKKFFNVEEGMHTPTKEFEVFDKMDGSLIIAFNYNNEWVIATRGSFVSDQAKAASKLFTNKGMNTDVTYLFEFTAPWNRIVLDYGQNENLTLLGGVITKSGEEVSWEHLVSVSELNDYDLVRKFDFKSLNDLKNKIPDDREGYVIKFKNGDRCKIKGLEYVRLHRIMTNVSTKSIWETVSNNLDMESIIENVPDEFYNSIKEYENSLREDYRKIEQSVFEKFETLKNVSDRKVFSNEVKDEKYKSLLFKLLDGKSITNDIWRILKPEYKKL